MKNNIKIFLLFILLFNFYFYKADASDEFAFESKSIEILNSSNITAKDGVIITSKDGIKISAYKSNYEKTSKILILEKDIVIDDLPNKLTLKSEKVIYDKTKEKIFSKKKN